MMRISYDNLLTLLQKSPLVEVEEDDDLSSAHFYIMIGDKPEGLPVRTETYELSNSYEMFVDVGKDGKVYSIEFY